ncbi:MAG: carboxypeptidase-like regulatory domain-containing protein, partial [Acidobacteriota bacterium]
MHFRRNQGIRALLCSLVWIAFALGATAHAQSTTGSIYGALTDSTGAAVPNGIISAKDVHTGLVTTVTSNASGEYVIPNVKPSDYVVTGTAKGFKTQNETEVAVSANQNVHVVFSLAPGEASETVDVTAAVTLVDTRGSALAETIEQERIQNLPTLNRSTYDLV